jgi:hypothetical protein
MATKTNSKQVLLNVQEIIAIRTLHPPTANAIQKIVDYINQHVVPQQGNKVQPK